MRRSIDIPGYRHGKNPIPAACRLGDLVATGGVHGLDIASGELPEDPALQVRHLFANMEAILDAAGASWDSVLKLNVVISDVEVRDHLNIEWVRVFGDPETRPARYTSINPHLPNGIRVQCEALALADH